MVEYYSEKLTKNQILNIPLFSGISDDMIPTIESLLEIKEYKQGKYVFQEGDEATKIFFIIEGSAHVVKKSITGFQKGLVELTSPELFGEMALLDKGRRSASVIASSSLITAELSYNNFFQIFSQKPEFAIFLYKGLARELSMRIRHINTKYAST